MNTTRETRPAMFPRPEGDQGRPNLRKIAVEPTNILPDRSLEPDGVNLPTVAVRSAGKHPFVYKKMVIGPVGGALANDGDLVRVVDRDNLHLGFGLWNGRSQIAVRLIAPDLLEPPGSAFWFDKLDRAVALRKDLLKVDAVSNAYRVIHAEGDGLSGLIVDRYDDVLSVEVFSLGMYQRIGPILEHLASRLGTKHVRVHVDERIALAEDFPGRPIVSPKLPPRVTVHENGVRFRVDFSSIHKTGFFCDQRENRLQTASFCEGRSMLDLCCHSGGFGVYALTKGKAREATGVDLDEQALELARGNANLNQVKLNLVHADAFNHARQLGVNGKTHGVVVLDPPKLIPGRDDIDSGKRKYFDLNVLAMKLVEKDGLFLTCSCSGLLPPEEFLYLLRAAAFKAGRAAQVLAVTGASSDHPVGLDALEGSYLKAVWLLMGDARESR